MEGHLLMSRKELQRKPVLELLEMERITLLEASVRMNLSYRQTLRVFARYVAEGDDGLVHRRRGKPSNRARPSAFRNKVVERYKTRYKPHEVGPTLAAEKLAEDDGLVVDHETLRRWLLSDGAWERQRKSQAHRSRRERKAHFGELVQMDGSHHGWFGSDHPKACLMNMVDDATGDTLGLMDHQETTEAAMSLLRRWIEKYGIPVALYTDRKNVYITSREPTLEEQLAGEIPLTAFGKACKKLGIAIIAAHSPQAKGRVERSNGTYQDRFLKELALRRITTCATADKLLNDSFCDALNDKFAIAPREVQDYHRPLPEGLDLDDVFCFESHRVVQNDWCIRHENRYYQILKSNQPLPKPKEKILVRTHLDGRTVLLHRDESLAFQALTPKQLHQLQNQEDQAVATTATAAARRTSKPGEGHPWRQGCSLMRGETTP
jgi:hypothetical protein